MRRELAALVIAALGGAALARAQATCTAVGLVVDGAGQPVSGVDVLLEFKGRVPQKYQSQTDEKGRFVKAGVPAGAYRLTFRKEGYGQVTLEAVIRPLPASASPPQYRMAKQVTGSTPRAARAEAPTRPPSPEKAAIQAAADLLKVGRLDEAEVAYRALLAKAPQDPALHFSMALVHGEKNAAGEAEASFRKALELDPKFTQAWSALAALLTDTGKGGEALETLGRGVAANPGDKKLLFAQAETALKLNKLDDASAALLKLEAVDPSNAEVQYDLATVALNQNRTDDAVARLEKYLLVAPADAPNVAAARTTLAALRGNK